MHTYIYTLDAATPYNLFHHLFVLSPLLTHVLCLIVAFTYGSLQLFCSISLILRNILLDNSDDDWSASFPLWEISFVTLLLRMLMTRMVGLGGTSHLAQSTHLENQTKVSIITRLVISN